METIQIRRAGRDKEERLLRAHITAIACARNARAIAAVLKKSYEANPGGRRFRRIVCLESHDVGVDLVKACGEWPKTELILVNSRRDPPKQNFDDMVLFARNYPYRSLLQLIKMAEHELDWVEEAVGAERAGGMDPRHGGLAKLKGELTCLMAWEGSTDVTYEMYDRALVDLVQGFINNVGLGRHIFGLE